MSVLAQQAAEIFDAVVALPTAAGRAAYLSAACGQNAALRSEVEQLLQHDNAAGSFLESPAVGLGATADSAPPNHAEPQTSAAAPAEHPGTVIGPYKLLEQVGEGGMGTVWMAQQTEPVKRLVAVKLIKPGMDSRQVIARFEAERQALALMDYPNIAKVHDAGTTPDGRPYFVMELVKGVPITRYCDERRLTPRQRLELFVPVCQAIQHAHQKGIIHRDLKPSNVLVALYDDRPVPKVIDFGVAKATGQQLTEQTLHTGFGAVVGTVEYMSPEQAGFNQLDVDTRSDIYSLGVLLYELLTGSPPFTRKELERAGMLEMLRVIREQEPSKPSTKLSTAEGLPTLAANRGTEPAKLTKLVRGELDWIVMKALEKDRNRRYDTANGFAADLLRYLADEPVQACPPSAVYRLRKFARRHRTSLAIALGLVFMVLLTIIGLAVSTLLIYREQQRKEAALEAAADQNRRAGANLRLALESLERLYVDFAEDRLSHRPDLKPLQREFLQKALKFYEAFAQENRGEPTVRMETGKALLRVGNIQREFGDLQKAELAYNQAITLLEKLAADGSPSPECLQFLGICQNHLGSLLTETGLMKEAESAHRQAVAQLKKLVGGRPEVPDYRQDLGDCFQGLGLLLRRTKRLKEAIDAHQSSIDLLGEVVKERPTQAGSRHRLAIAYINLGATVADTGPTRGWWENPRSWRRMNRPG
jgi:serine/threonine protein kinase